MPLLTGMSHLSTLLLSSLPLVGNRKGTEVPLGLFMTGKGPFRELQTESKARTLLNAARA